MINAKAKGSRNERRSRDLLEAAGYRCCKSGASLGVWDIIGIGSKDVVLVQVKSNHWPRPAEMEEITNFKCPDNCKRLVHRWRDRQRLPDVKVI